MDGASHGVVYAGLPFAHLFGYIVKKCSSALQCIDFRVEARLHQRLLRFWSGSIFAAVNPRAAAAKGQAMLSFRETTSNGTGLLRFVVALSCLAFLSILCCIRFPFDSNNKPSFIPTFESIFFPFWVWRILAQPWR